MVFSIAIDIKDLILNHVTSVLCQTAAVKSGKEICGDISRDQTQPQHVHVGMYNLCSQPSRHNSLPSDVTLSLHQRRVI